MTWWLWLVLVVGALVVYAVIGLGLWRRGKALLRELQGLEQVSERLAAVSGSAPPPPIVPGYLASPGVLAQERQVRERNLRTRRTRRAGRAADAMDRWRALGLR